MLAAQPERLAEAFGLLDPSHRALLELSLRREVADPALAELLRTDVDTVGRQRVQALEQLGSMLDASAGEVEGALIDQWRSEAGEGEAEEVGSEAEDPEAEEPVAAEETEAEETDAEEPSGEEPEAEEPDPEAVEEADPAAPPPVPGVRPNLEGPAGPRRRGVWIGLVAGIAAVIVLVSLGGDDDESPEPNTPADTQASTSTEPGDTPPADDGPEPVELDSVLDSGGAGGTARLVGSGGRQRVELRLRGLGKGSYALWLYDSIGEARALASFRGPAPFVRARLPKDYGRFGFLDVSQEPDDGNSNHSGASVLRVPTKSLPAG